MHEFILLDEIAEKELVPGFNARLIHTENMSIAHVTAAKGSTLPEHKHMNEQITNVIEGELEMTVGGQAMVCGPGTVVNIPSNVPHSARALTDCYVIDVFQPVREDYK